LEGSGFRFTETPELPTEGNDDRWEENSYCKIPMGSKIRTLRKKREECGTQEFKII